MQSDLKEKITAAVPIESYIGRFTPLKSVGSSFQGLCPFHKEKTPSFHVSPVKGLYHCFGCGQGGDLFRFVMDYEGISFTETLKLLAQYASIPTDSVSSSSHKKIHILEDLNQRTMKSFQTFFHSAQGDIFQRYLAQRGIHHKSIQDFQIGACPNERNWIEKQLPNYENELLTLGLLRRSEKTGKNYNFFHNRVIFPIFNVAGKIAGFGARTIPGKDTAAKYINSSDSILFKKSNLLYGFYQNLHELRKKQEALIVEGYLDVIGLNQAGENYSCAPLGTSFGIHHLKLLSRYVKHICLIFDGDFAGIQAAKRAVELSIHFPQLSCSLILLPPDKDPLDLSLSLSKKELHQLLNTDSYRIPAWKFFVMESINPGGFWNQKISSKQESKENANDPLITAQLASQYYRGKIPESLPVGGEKRQALERLYTDLKPLQNRESDCRFLLEEASYLLKLDIHLLLKEWKNHYLEKNTTITPSKKKNPTPNDKKNILKKQSMNHSSIQAGGIDVQTDPISAKGQVIQKRLIECERNLLIELLFFPKLMEEYQNTLALIEWEDLQSEFLWRQMESCALRGNIWTSGSLKNLELPEECRNLFTSLVMGYFDIQEKGVENPDTKGIFEQYLTRHETLRIEKNSEKIKSIFSVSDVTSQRDLIEEQCLLTEELKRLRGLQNRSTIV